MTTDATQITGSQVAGAGGDRLGDVLCERYELLEIVEESGLAHSYRAQDQETERAVLVRMLAAPLDEEIVVSVLERLRGLIGVGGRFLSSLLDVDREARTPFTVEAWPTGTQLSAIFEARRTRGESLGPREVLPVAARLCAALAALPEPWHHGDVRAEQVWVDTDGLRLTGAFLLSALPARIVAERISELGPAATLYAPELASGRIGAPADRWGVAAIAWEALTSRPPDDAAGKGLSPQLRAALRRLLDPEPGRRSKELAPLLSALADQAALSVPAIDPEPHRPASARIGAPPGSSPASRSTRPTAKKVEGAAPEGTQEISLDQIEELPAEGLDPRLVRAALTDAPKKSDNVEKKDTARQTAVLAPPSGRDTPARRNKPKERRADDLDPRLVRAALAAPPSVEELASDEIHIADSSPGTPAFTKAPIKPPQPARRPQPAPRPAPKPRPAPSGGPSFTAPSPRPTPKPQPKPQPAPTQRGAPKPEAPAFTVPAKQETKIPSSPPAPEKAKFTRPSVTGPTPRTEAKEAARRRSMTGPLIVIIAVLVAIAIVASGFVIAKQRRDAAQRSREIQERLQQLRNGHH
jgi:hypothetical protein